MTQSNALCISTSRLLQPLPRPHSQLSCTRGGEEGGPQVNLSRIGAVRLQRAEAALPRHGMAQNSQSMRKASVAQRWLYLRSRSECFFVATHAVNMLRTPLAINPRSRLRWSCDRDPVECTLHFYFALVAAAASAAFAVVLHAWRRGRRSTCKSFKDRSRTIAKG